MKGLADLATCNAPPRLILTIYMIARRVGHGQPACDTGQSRSFAVYHHWTACSCGFIHKLSLTAAQAGLHQKTRWLPCDWPPTTSCQWWSTTLRLAATKSLLCCMIEIYG